MLVYLSKQIPTELVNLIMIVKSFFCNTIVEQGDYRNANFELLKCCGMISWKI